VTKLTSVIYNFSSQLTADMDRNLCKVPMSGNIKHSVFKCKLKTIKCCITFAPGRRIKTILEFNVFENVVGWGIFHKNYF
jgi:hypothetical protein